MALKIATGGGLGMLGLVAIGHVIKLQAGKLRAGVAILETAPACEGIYGRTYSGTPIEFVMMGDSSAAGVGVTLAAQTPGAVMAHQLATALNRPVRLRCTAVPKALSAGLAAQVTSVVSSPPDLVLISIGANDITHRTRTSLAVAQLDRAVRELIASGAKVVVGTCPDLSSLEGMQPPLRWITQFWCRELAAAQTMAAVRAGARTVSLANSLRAEFGSRPHEFFAEDRFHPSAAGYLRAAEAMLPSLIEALGYAGELAPTPSRPWSLIRAPRSGLRPLAKAAVDAADTAGTEVVGVPALQGHRGMWGQLRNRLTEATQLARQQLPRLNGRRGVNAGADLNGDAAQRSLKVMGDNGKLVG